MIPCFPVTIKWGGVRKTDVSIKSIREGKIETTALFTVKMSWKKGEFENMGSFEDKILHLSNKPKRWRPYPNEIIEKLDSEMLTAIEMMERMRQPAS